MSRNIITTASHRKEEEKAPHQTETGKLLFTEYQGKMLALYLKQNRCLAAQVLTGGQNRIGAVYIGKIKNIVKNINACFVEIAQGEICFLSLKDAQSPMLLNRCFDGRLLQGDELPVQIIREAQKTKQASVTASVSLANDFAAVSLGATKTGYSGKLSRERREQIREWLTGAHLQEEDHLIQENLPAPTGLVVRTLAGESTRDELLGNIRKLLDDFRSLLTNASHRTCFSCIREAPADFEAVLDQLVYPYEFDGIVTDDAALYEKLRCFCEDKLPQKQVRLYNDPVFSLAKLYSLEQKLDTALNRRVWLKSGGYLVIEPTEALTVIDVNSGKYEAKKAPKGATASEAAFEQINREAAAEIALQLRLRNLSGIILVDFINMETKERGEALVEYLRELVRRDKLKTSVVDITPLGLVEITRKKRNRPLREQLRNQDGREEE